MASILVIEDGTIVEDANSYASAEEARAYATLRAITSLPAAGQNSDPLENLLIQAMDYLESKRAMYQGTKVDAEQCLQFPRNDVYIDGTLADYTKIPKILKNAQIALAVELSNGIDPLASNNEAFVKKETVGPITTEYAEGDDLGPSIPAVDALLQPLFKSGIVGFSLRTIRV